MAEPLHTLVKYISRNLSTQTCLGVFEKTAKIMGQSEALLNLL